MASAILAGIGFQMSSVFMTVTGLTIFYGMIFGLAMSMGYAALTPAAVKWFGPEKRGFISGIVVSGFGLAPIFMAPLTTHLIGLYGINKTFFLLGAGFFVVIMILSQFISNPPKDYIPEKTSSDNKTLTAPKPSVDLDWKEVLKTKQFYILWIMFCCGTFAGLLLIGQMAKIGSEQAGMTQAFQIVTVCALFNFLGRIGCGVLSDKWGRNATLFLMFMLQFTIYMCFNRLINPISLSFGVAVVGFTFGGMLTLFPAANADHFGMKNFGMNHGMLITAWGIGGITGPLLGGLVRDMTGGYSLIYIISALVSLSGAMLSLYSAYEAGTFNVTVIRRKLGLMGED